MISTYVSPMIVFWRRIARASMRSGAYLRSSSIVASVRLPCGSSDLSITLPTLTPAIRTSACVASWPALGNAILTRYPCGLNGIVPPNESHRNSSSPTHESANRTIVSTRVTEGVPVSIYLVGSCGRKLGVGVFGALGDAFDVPVSAARPRAARGLSVPAWYCL